MGLVPIYRWMATLRILSAVAQTGELAEVIEKLSSSEELLRDILLHKLDLSYLIEVLVVASDLEIFEIPAEDLEFLGSKFL